MTRLNARVQKVLCFQLLVPTYNCKLCIEWDSCELGCEKLRKLICKLCTLHGGTSLKNNRSFCTLETFENVVERVLVQQCFFELSSTKSR
jgi:hypothetical protein